MISRYTRKNAVTCKFHQPVYSKGVSKIYQEQGRSKQQRGGDFFDHRKSRGTHFFWKKKSRGAYFFSKKKSRGAHFFSNKKSRGAHFFAEKKSPGVKHFQAFFDSSDNGALTQQLIFEKENHGAYTFFREKSQGADFLRTRKSRGKDFFPRFTFLTGAQFLLNFAHSLNGLTMKALFRKIRNAGPKHYNKS